MIGMVFEWLRRRPTQAALRGAPATRRIKNRSAASGYVYEYFYLGYREAGPATEYVFEFSADRRNWQRVSVLLSGSAVRAWEDAHGRQLVAAERYAAAKLALMEAFDSRPSPAQMSEAVCVGATEIEPLLAPLGL